MKFITTVSMRVTQEQFEQDLKQPLIDLGYDLSYMTNITDGYCDTLCTNNNRYDNRVNNIDYNLKDDYHRHFIDHYNPKLFLALAAMTDNPKGIVGEWFKAVNNYSGQFTRDELYQKREQNFYFMRTIDDANDKNGWAYTNFTKATKEELIKSFGNSKADTATTTPDPVQEAIETLRKAGYKGTLTKTETKTIEI